MKGQPVQLQRSEWGERSEVLDSEALPTSTHALDIRVVENEFTAQF